MRAGVVTDVDKPGIKFLVDMDDPVDTNHQKPWHLNLYHEVVPISNCNLRHFFALVFQLQIATQIKLDFY